MTKVRVFVADDHLLVRQGLCRFLESQPGWEIVGQAGDGREAVTQTLALKPDIAILDISMPIMNGIEATRQIHRRMPQLPILILTMHEGDHYVSSALKAGAVGYLLKDACETELVNAVRAVTEGKSFLSPSAARIMVADYVRGNDAAAGGVVDRYDSLSEREREVLQLVAEGHSTKEIAHLLSVSPTTAETHRTHLLQKLDVHNTAQLVRYALRRGVVT